MGEHRVWEYSYTIKKRTTLVAQWLEGCLAMQEMRVWSLVQEDPTYSGAPKPAVQLPSLRPRAYEMQWLSPLLQLQKPLLHNGKPAQREAQVRQLDSSHLSAQLETQRRQKEILKKKKNLMKICSFTSSVRKLASPEVGLKIGLHVQVVYWRSVPRKMWMEWENQNREGEEARKGCDFRQSSSHAWSRRDLWNVNSVPEFVLTVGRGSGLS